MKKIGLVGGTGPESTLMYYKELNHRIDRLTGGKAMPDIAIESVNFRRMWGYVSDNELDLLTDYFVEKIDCLERSGAEVVSLTCATGHIVIDRIKQKTNVPLVSIPEAVCEKAAVLGIKKVGLLGTIFTMEQNFMKQPFINAGIGVFIPEPTDRQLIAKRILEELERGIVKEQTLKEFQDIIGKMKAQNGIEAVILGCTELPLLLNSENCPVTCLNSVDIHIEKLIGLAMG